MKDSESKILEMLAAGTITTEQAKMLLDEIRRDSGHDDDGKGLFERVIDAVSGGRTSSVRGVLPSDLNDNDFSMSRVDLIGGQDYQFRNNRVRMSNVSKMQLTRAKLVDCDIGTSHLADFDAVDSTLSRATIHASSMSDIKLKGAQVMTFGLRASRFTDAVIDDSMLDDVEVNASSIRNFVVQDDSHWQRSRIDSSDVKGLVTKRTKLEEMQVDVAKVSGLVLVGSTLRMSMLRGYKWTDVKIIDSTFTDVLFGSGDVNRYSKFHDFTFEGCSFTKVIFTDASFVDVKVRNVSLSDVKVDGVHLRDVTLDGNEAFLAAVGGNQRALVVR